MVIRINLFKRFVQRIKQDDLSALGAQLAYSFLLAFFPFLIFLISLIGFSSIDSREVLIGLKKVVPMEVYSLIDKMVVQVVDNKSIKLLSFGFITTVWAASNGFMAVIKALNKAYEDDEKRGFVQLQLIALACTFGLAFIILTSFSLIVLGEINGNILSRQLGLGIFFKKIWNILRHIAVFTIMVFIFASLFHLTPCRKITWKEVIPGAIFTTVGWIVSSELFSYYVNNFGNYSQIYGSLGAVIVFMTWLFIISEMLLVGGEINATLSNYGKSKKH